MARRLTREEGLFVGGSTGLIVHVALHVARRVDDPDALGDFARRDCMVAGHHDHPNPGLPAIGNCLLHLHPRWIAEAHKTEEGELLIARELLCGDCFLGEGEHTQAIFGKRRGSV